MSNPAVSPSTSSDAARSRPGSPLPLAPASRAAPRGHRQRGTGHGQGGDALAWAGVKQMRSASDTLSARIGLGHRVLFRIAGEHLEIVDVVARKNLESALRRR